MRGICLTLALVVTATCLGCGGSDPEAELVQASQAVEHARTAVEAARELVTKREAEVQQAQARLTEARAALREAQEKVAKGEAKVDRRATDAVLFRAVQKQLLTDDALREVAISATVTNGNVTLAGTVNSAKQRDRALELARATPGVGQVESRITVSTPAAKKPAD